MTVNVDTIDGLMAAPTKDDTLVIGIDQGELTPLDALDERLTKGDQWIESDTVCEVLP